MTLFFRIDYCAMKGAVPNERFCSSHRLCWSHLNDIWHVNCIHHVWNFRKRNHWNWVAFGPLTAHLIVTSDKQKMRFSGSLLTPPPELAGWAGRVASSKLNDCTHPPTTSWGGRGNKKSQTTNKDNWSTTWLNMSWDLLVFRVWIFCWQKKLQSLFVCLGLSVPSHAVND